jgi:predicted RNA-binding Zn-ribbon protein involved in translation (DUF1610 family)
MPIVFKCSTCGLAMNARDDEVGSQHRCPMCEAVTTVPEVTDPTASGLQAYRISKSTFQIVCPKCQGTHNFRESSLGSSTKCRSCGFKMKLPTPEPEPFVPPIKTYRPNQSGCLVVLLMLAIAGAAIAGLN